MDNKKFESFLESLKGNGQNALIESVKKGFQACFESYDYNNEIDPKKDWEFPEVDSLNERNIDEMDNGYTTISILLDNIGIPENESDFKILYLYRDDIHDRKYPSDYQYTGDEPILKEHVIVSLNKSWVDRRIDKDELSRNMSYGGRFSINIKEKPNQYIVELKYIKVSDN